MQKGAKQHSRKYLVAVINLLSQSDRFDTLPDRLQEEIDSWFDTNRPMQLRNDALYTRVNKQGRITTPDQMSQRSRAALHVYLADFAAVALGEYVDLERSWVESVLQRAENFGTQHLKT